MSIEFSRPIKTDSIPSEGRETVITASEDECVALATRFDVLSITDLNAKITIRQSDMRTNYHVSGTLNASVTQECTVTGVDVESKITEEFEAWFTDQEHITDFVKAKADKDRAENDDEHEMREEKDDPERVIGGAIDIGELTAQYLGLAIDPYPRADGVAEGDYIESKPEDKPNPFAALAALKDKK